MSVEIAVSYGELFDKISILEIKQSKVVNADQRINIENELNFLNRIRATIIPSNFKMQTMLRSGHLKAQRMRSAQDAKPCQSVRVVATP